MTVLCFGQWLWLGQRGHFLHQRSDTLNPVIGKVLYRSCQWRLLAVEKTKNKERMGNLNINWCWLSAVWPDWTIYCTLGNLSKPVTPIILPKLPRFFGIFVKLSKSVIFLVKSFLGNFYRHLVTFYWLSGARVNVLNKFLRVSEWIPCTCNWEEMRDL